jgi:hypothetical protein
MLNKVTESLRLSDLEAVVSAAEFADRIEKPLNHHIIIAFEQAQTPGRFNDVNPATL